MPVKILMPALSPTMTDGKLAKWHVAEGDNVNSGDVIAEIETDKATMEVEAVEEGTVGKLLVSEGSENVAVNAVIALLLEEGESDGDLEGVDVSTDAGPAPTPTPAPEPTPAPAAPAPAPTPPATSADNAQRIFASPLAKRMAQQAGLDLSAISGSGPNGRIIKRDVESALSGGLPAVAAAAEVPAPVTASAPAADPFEPEFELVELTSMRKTIAARLTESKQTVPHFYLRIDCEIDKLLAFRKELNDKADGAYKLSVNDIVIKAAGVALKKVPTANASWSNAGLKLYKSADISVAVAIDGGLITPVIRNADAKGLEDISNEMRALAEKARDGKLMPEEYQGGTFSISNLGMYGVQNFDAVINPASWPSERENLDPWLKTAHWR